MHVNARRPYKPLREIQELGHLARTWQRMLPDEPRPAFEEAQLKHIHRFLSNRQEPEKMEAIRAHNGLMHEHDARSARIIERTLRTGLIDRSVLHSFRDGRVHQKPPPRVDPEPLPSYLPDVEVHHQHNETHYEISHFGSDGSAHVQERAPSHILSSAE